MASSSATRSTGRLSPTRRLLPGKMRHAPAALQIVAARILHQNAPHQLGGNRKKVRAVLPLHALVIHQAHVGFIHQRRGLKAVAGAFAPQVTARQAAEFLINNRGQPLKRACPRCPKPEAAQSRRPPPHQVAVSALEELYRWLGALFLGYRDERFCTPFCANQYGGQNMKPIVTSVAAAGLLAALAVAQTQPRYTVTDLGTLGGDASVAYGINNTGRVAGGANLKNGSQHPFLSVIGGLLFDIGTPGGPNGNVAGPNAANQVGGLAETGTTDPNGEDFCGYGTHLICTGIFWNGALMRLPTLGGNNGEGVNLNNLGQVVGFAETGNKDSTCAAPQMLEYEGVIWGPAPGEIQELPPLAGDTVGFALGINDLGQAVGSTGTCANTPLLLIAFGPHAVLWDNGTPINLGSLGGQMINAAAAINNLGQVVGGLTMPDNQTLHAYIWTRQTGMEDMGVLGSDAMALPTWINDNGQVVGTSCDNDGDCRAFFWQNKTMTDLNTLAPPNSPLYLLFANSINDSGSIVGLGLDMNSGNTHAFLATPCGTHSSSAWCEGGSAANVEQPMGKSKVVLPENVRKMLQRRLPRLQETDAAKP